MEAQLSFFLSMFPSPKSVENGHMLLSCKSCVTGTAAALFAGLVPQARAETDAAAGDPLSSSSTLRAENTPLRK